jgi:hypothetical protein
MSMKCKYRYLLVNSKLAALIEMRDRARHRFRDTVLQPDDDIRKYSNSCLCNHGTRLSSDTRYVGGFYIEPIRPNVVFAVEVPQSTASFATREKKTIQI